MSHYTLIRCCRIALVVLGTRNMRQNVYKKGMMGLENIKKAVRRDSIIKNQFWLGMMV